jgi:hypothetical protein
MDGTSNTGVAVDLGCVTEKVFKRVGIEPIPGRWSDVSIETLQPLPE